MTTNPKEPMYDITIIGGGIAGLMTAKKASALGMKTLLIEISDRLASGPSTRNEGWLHAGTYHAYSIKDKADAILVAQRSLYGHDQIKMYAPEVIEYPLTKSVCLISERDPVEEILDRWNEAGVTYTELDRNSFFQELSNINREHVAHVFEVADLSINTRMLYARLLQDAKTYGTTVVTNTEIQFHDSGNPILVSKSKREKFQSRLFIYTVGYNAGDISRNQLGVELSLRYWKSHLLITPKLTERCVFYLSEGEATLMNHQHCSIIGFNKDSYSIQNQDFGLDHDRVTKAITSLRRLIHLPNDLRYVPFSCIKVDPTPENSSPSLNVNILEPKPDHIFAFPGKMTETPYLVDMLMQMVFERIKNDNITLRPCDETKM